MIRRFSSLTLQCRPFRFGLSKVQSIRPIRSQFQLQPQLLHCSSRFASNSATTKSTHRKSDSNISASFDESESDSKSQLISTVVSSEDESIAASFYEEPNEIDSTSKSKFARNSTVNTNRLLNATHLAIIHQTKQIYSELLNSFSASEDSIRIHRQKQKQVKLNDETESEFDTENDEEIDIFMQSQNSLISHPSFDESSFSSIQMSAEETILLTETSETSLNSNRSTNLFQLVIAGDFNSAKSSLINALLDGENVCKVGVLPTTETIHIIQYRQKPSTNASDEEVDDEEDDEDSFQSSTRVHLPCVDTLYSSHALLRDVQIVDTPGSNSVHLHHTLLTRRIVPRADALVLVTSAERPFTNSERELLRLARQWHSNSSSGSSEAASKRSSLELIVCVNKIDTVASGEDRRAVLDFVRKQVGKVMSSSSSSTSNAAADSVAVIGISSRQAIQAKQLMKQPQPQVEKSNSHSSSSSTSVDALTLLHLSGVPQLEALLHRTLSTQRRVRLKLRTPVDLASRVIDARLLPRVRHASTSLHARLTNAQLVVRCIEQYAREAQATADDELRKLDDIFASQTRIAQSLVAQHLSFGFLSKFKPLDSKSTDSSPTDAELNSSSSLESNSTGGLMKLFGLMNSASAAQLSQSYLNSVHFPIATSAHQCLTRLLDSQAELASTCLQSIQQLLTVSPQNDVLMHDVQVACGVGAKANLYERLRTAVDSHLISTRASAEASNVASNIQSASTTFVTSQTAAAVIAATAVSAILPIAASPVLALAATVSGFGFINLPIRSAQLKKALQQQHSVVAAAVKRQCQLHAETQLQQTLKAMNAISNFHNQQLEVDSEKFTRNQTRLQQLKSQTADIQKQIDKL